MKPAHARPSDDVLKGFDELLAPGLPGPVAAVYETAGSAVESISTMQATWRPGRQVTTRYRITAKGGDLDGRRDVVATIGQIPDGAAVIEGSDTRVGVWVVPNDPHLPGLRSALDVPTVAGLASDLGVRSKVTRTRLRAYRPGRRAVVEVIAGRALLFLKVVPPSEAPDLHERHRLLSDLPLVPDSSGIASDLGIVVMPALPGFDLRATLRSGGPVPSPEEIANVIRGLPDPRNEWERGSPIETLPGIMELLTNLLPSETDRLQRLADDIGPETAVDRVPVHGDFHEAQILVDGGRPVGLIDVDSYGWGRPGDDAATMLGHLHLLAPSCKRTAEVLELARALHRRWDRSLDPVDLRRRTAAVVLGLATGPFRVQSPNWPAETRERITIAEEWVKSARRVDERSLTPTSERSHVAAR